MNLVKFILLMYISQHSDFILSPLIKILKDGIAASRAIGDGIDSHPMGEYLMQSLFLKMTGAQEQKMKCICWELATQDYDYRYDFINRKKYGECSTYSSKNGIFNDLIEVIQKMLPSFEPSTLINEAFLNNIHDDIEKLYSTSNLCIWQNREYLFFKSKFRTVLNIRQLYYPIGSVKSYNLFKSELSKRYEEVVYRHRNRCAHNSLSYQVNKPDFSVLASTNFSYHSYFFRFALIVLIDEIFMALFRKYVSLQN